MSYFLVFLLPFGGALISCCAAYTSHFWLLKGIKEMCSKEALMQMLRSEDLKHAINEQWQALNLEEDIQMLVNHHLDGLFVTFKNQVPMLGMFLSIEREEKLKEQARMELMKLVPSLKQRLIEKFVDQGALQEVMIGIVSARVLQPFGSILLHKWKSMKYVFFAKAFLQGFCFGLLEAGLLALFPNIL